MTQKLYLECYSGISGDMTVAALLDLGADPEVLDKALRSLPVTGFETKISRVSKSGIDACDFNVILEHENHDHDMEYLHGDKKTENAHEHKHEHDHEHHHHHHGIGHLLDHLLHREHHHDHEHEHEHGHSHTHEHTHDHSHEHSHSHSHSHGHGHDHVHRGLAEITDIINKGDLTDKAKATALKIFDIIADAEAKAHGLPKNEVHFHEVGAVDSIVDIVAVAVCLDNLGIEEVIVPVLYEGTGTVRCQHGILPIPVPAVANIVNAQNLNLHMTNTQGEFVTPTGAAIVAAIKTEDTLPENFKVLRTGIGAGKRNYERPSLLRAMLIEQCAAKNAEKEKKDEIIKLESNIDDCTGESLGFAMEHLLAAGARDVHYFPVFMKKNRPGYQLNVICKEEQIEKLSNIIFEDTTTIGIRIQRMERYVLEREIQKVSTPFGESRVKVCTLPSGKKRYYPEYDDVARISKDAGISYQDAFRHVISKCSN